MKKKELIGIIAIITIILVFLVLKILYEPNVHVKEIYLDPTDLNKQCNKENSKSITLTRTGCMKWYIYNSDEETYTMILDHNIAVSSSFNGNKSYNSIVLGYNDVLSILTADWKVKARLISAEEIVDIIDYKEFNKENYDIIYFENQEHKLGRINNDRYSWLIENTYECKKLGCKNEDPEVLGYWTSTENSQQAWYVTNGYISTDLKTISNYYGIRPVIEVSKSLID